METGAGVCEAALELAAHAADEVLRGVRRVVREAPGTDFNEEEPEREDYVDEVTAGAAAKAHGWCEPLWELGSAMVFFLERGRGG